MDDFRVELAWVKLVGIAVLLAPVPARIKEWAYAGFAITLASALIAHLAVGEGVDAWGWAAGTAVLWALSYGMWGGVSAAGAFDSAVGTLFSRRLHRCRMHAASCIAT